MMEEMIRKCRLCQEPMPPSPFMTCPSCLADSEKVKTYILKHPHVTPEKIAEATEVPLDKVSNMVKLGVNSK